MTVSRVVVFGDSIAAGLGVREASYPALVARALGRPLVNLAASAMTIAGSTHLLGEVSASDIVIIAHGITEAILRPRDSLLRYLPKRYRRAGWLDPRPYLSSSEPRRQMQRLESEVRWRVKVALLHRYGGTRLLSASDFAACLTAMLSTLRSVGAKIVLVGPPALDEAYFPGSGDSLREYATLVRDLAGNDTFVDIWNACRRWDDYTLDHFHPNDSGHLAIARAILDAIQPERRGHLTAQRF